MTQEWPKLDPVTGRSICENCWNGVHYHELMSRKNFHGQMENYYVKRDRLSGHAMHACNGPCDCVHLSEETWAAMERTKRSSNRKELRKTFKAQLEDASNPLVSVNGDYKKTRKGKIHA